MFNNKKTLFILASIFVLGLATVSYATFVEPTFTPSGGNTPKPLLTSGDGDVRMYENMAIAIIHADNEQIKAELAKDVKDQNWTRAGGINEIVNNLMNVNGSPITYVFQGLFSEKFVNFKPFSTVGDVIVRVPQDYDRYERFKNIITSGYQAPLETIFDQYTTPVKFVDKVAKVYSFAKPTEAIIAGRLVSKLAVTNEKDVDYKDQTKNNIFNLFSIIDGKKQNTSYDLLLQPEEEQSITTNIGLGNTCNLYPQDLGTSVTTGGGCPQGSYMSYYANLDSYPYDTTKTTDSNKTNGTVVAKCTFFDPALKPTNIGACYTQTNPISVTWGPVVGDDCSLQVPSHCLKDAWYYKSNNSNYWTPGLPSGVSAYDKCSKYSGYSFAFDGRCESVPFSGNYNNTVYQQPVSKKQETYKCTNTVTIDRKKVKLPTTLSNNIFWYRKDGTKMGYTDQETTTDNGCKSKDYVDEVRVMDLYGQYFSAK